MPGYKAVRNSKVGWSKPASFKALAIMIANASGGPSVVTKCIGTCGLANGRNSLAIFLDSWRLIDCGRIASASLTRNVLSSSASSLASCADSAASVADVFASPASWVTSASNWSLLLLKLLPFSRSCPLMCEIQRPIQSSPNMPTVTRTMLAISRNTT
jgi:hypothetical protein